MTQNCCVSEDPILIIDETIVIRVKQFLPDKIIMTDGTVYHVFILRMKSDDDGIVIPMFSRSTGKINGNRNEMKEKSHPVLFDNKLNIHTSMLECADYRCKVKDGWHVPKDEWRMFTFRVVLDIKKWKLKILYHGDNEATFHQDEHGIYFHYFESKKLYIPWMIEKTPHAPLPYTIDR